MSSVLAPRDFRLLWASQTVSVVGDSLILVAVGLFVTRLTGDPGDVGLVLAAYAAPLVLFLLAGGVVADRLSRKTVMVVSDVVRGALHGLLAVLIATGTVRVGHMVAIGLLFGTAEAFFRPAYTGLVPQTVPEWQIQPAFALSGMSEELAMVVSLALATALVLTVGGAAAFALDAATFGVSALLVAQIRGRPRGKSGGRSTLVRELRQGWQAVSARAWVWVTVASFAVAVLVTLAPLFVLGASVAQTVYGSSAVYGLATAAWGVGTASGAIVGGRWRPRHPMRSGILAAVPWPGCAAIFALGPPLPVLYSAMGLSGVGVGVFVVWWNTALAERIPPHLLSRVSAWDLMGSLALLPFGYVAAGPVGAAVGEARVLVGGGLLGMVVIALALLPRSTRALARLEAVPGPFSDGEAEPRAVALLPSSDLG